MNISKVLTMDYENWTLGERGKNKANSNPIQSQYKPNSNRIQTQNKPNTKPIFRGVASGEAGSKLTYCCIASLKRLCYLYDPAISLDSAKMAQYKNNWNLKNVGGKKLNLLKYKRLNILARLRPPTGTLFAHLNLWKFIYTDGMQ